MSVPKQRVAKGSHPFQQERVKNSISGLSCNNFELIVTLPWACWKQTTIRSRRYWFTTNLNVLRPG